MKHLCPVVLLALSVAAPVCVFAAEPATASTSAQGQAADTPPTSIALRDLMKEPKRYANQTLTVTGRYAGMCSDGEDFYFKDRFSTIEVLLPPGGMPKELKVGTPLRIQGQVLVRARDEVTIKPTVVEPDSATGKAP